MKLTKSQGIGLFNAFLLFGVFNIIVFLAPLTHTVIFWLGYFFALFALGSIAVTSFLYFGKSVKEDRFLNVPAVKVAWSYFLLQMGLSIWEMIAFPLPYMPALIINLVLGALFSVIILSLYAAAEKINKSEQFTAEEIIFIKQLKLKLDSVETDNADLEKKIKKLCEDIKFSDPMIHSELKGTELELDNITDKLIESVSDIETALVLCDKAAKLLKKRNELCKIYKGVKDTAAAEVKNSKNGRGIAIAGAGVVFILFLITLTVCFIVVPQVKYNDALALFEAEKFAEATIAFAELGDYRDSEEKIEEINITVLDKQYDAAVELMDAKNYNEAISAFATLGDYRDSKEKAEEIRNTVLDNQYNEAEELFNAGEYSKAINIYTALNDYKDSKLRVEQIYNRLSEGDILYFGTYNGEPIAWKIMKTEAEKILMITAEPVAEKPFHDEIKKITWETSSLREWLNKEFIESFSESQQRQIIATDADGISDKVFLFSVNEMEELVKEEKITFRTTDEWWTRTSSEEGIMYATYKGWVKAEGDYIIRDKGVRPAIWLSLD